MTNSLDAAAEIISEANEVIVTTHVQPDGDGLGALLGLALSLKESGRQVHATIGEEPRVPPQYRWMPGIQMINAPDRCPDYPVFVALDCATFERLGDLRPTARQAEHLINIDHHRDNDLFGTVNVVEESAAASCELVFDLVKRLGITMNADIATCLYTGIVTDTGRFQYSNTSADAFKKAAELLSYGVVPHRIFHKVYENMSLSTLKLLGLAISKLALVPDVGMIYTTIEREDLTRTGVSMDETETFIDYLRAVRGTVIAVMLKRKSDGSIRVNLRSRGLVDVAEIAKQAGGGGHRNAAGFDTDMAVEETVQWLVKQAEKQKPAIKKEIAL